ncbi:MAG: hypothetical protein AB7H86_21765 [Blastocatellales bacterium]
MLLLFGANTCSDFLPRSQSSDLAGKWKIEITFEKQDSRTLSFEADESGTGSLKLEGERSNWDEPAKPTKAKWMVESGKQMIIIAPIEFPIGNVGREPGILRLKGVFESESRLKGELAFFRMDQDPMDPNETPSKTGKFHAVRTDAKN